MISENDPFIAGSNYSTYSTADIPTITNSQCVFNKSITFVTPELPKIPGMHEIPKRVSIKKVNPNDLAYQVRNKQFAYSCRLNQHMLIHTTRNLINEILIDMKVFALKRYLNTHHPKTTYTDS